MAASAHASETYEPADHSALAPVHDFLQAHADAGRGDVTARYFLSGAGVGDQVEVPKAVHAVLLQVVEAMQRGFAVTVTPQGQVLSTQQAADLLGVSRPTVVKFLEKGLIPFDKVGAHRRLRLEDVLTYREIRKREQYDALAALSVDITDGDDVHAVLDDLRAARKAVRRDRAPRP